MRSQTRAWVSIMATLAVGLSACGGGGGDDDGGLSASQKKAYCAAVKEYAIADKNKSDSFDEQARGEAEAAKKVLPVSPADEKKWWERAVLIQSTLATGAREDEAYAKSPLKDQDDPRLSSMKQLCGVDLYDVG